VFTCILHLSYEGANIYDYDLEDFEYPDNESPYTVSRLLHNDDNPALIKNKEVKYYTLTTQILTEITFYNLLTNSGEYSHARGCAHLLVYCLLKGIRVNIPKLIINYILSENLFIPIGIFRLG